MTHTEKVALAMAWYDSGLEDRAAFQTLMESLFAQPEQEPCVHAKNPKGCYRIRCQLGDKCVDDEMSFRTAPPQRTEQNFCERCGKRTKDIHTCTPPRENT